MANPKHLAKLRQGVKVWNAWRLAHTPQNTDLSGASLTEADLQGVDFRNTNLIETKFSQANLSEADLSMAFLSNTDLQGANLSRAKLVGTIFTDAVLIETVLIEADLRGADVRRTNLLRSNFRDANLGGSDLSDANLSGAILIEADLQAAIFSRTNLQGADLSRGTFGLTTLANVDLSQVLGLESAHHVRPSMISTDTLVRSQGKMPEVFLRGCGLPESWIEYLPSLIGTLQPIQYHSCFISYASEDEAFAQRLHSRMQQEGLRVWFAPHDLRGGHKLRDQIDEAIHVHDKLLLVLSDASITSNWVTHEIRRAYLKGREQHRQVLFPISLAPYESFIQWDLIDDTGFNLATEVRRYYIPDFTHWKDYDAFEAAFSQLLTSLHNEASSSK